MSTLPPSTAVSRPRFLLPLLAVFLVMVGIFALSWWQQRQKQQWLSRASVDELAKEAGRNPNDAVIFEQLGQKAQREEEWARGAHAFQRACELHPDNAENWTGW